MRHWMRGSLVLSVLLWLIAGLPGAPGGGGVTPALAKGGPCGKQSDDADQVAAVRAEASEQCDCEGASRHDKYMQCVEKVAKAAAKDGSLREECKGNVMRCASMSTCGRPGFVTCCRTDEHGHTMCQIKHGEQDCKAPHGGSACVGSQSSCCDACAANGSCVPGETTTTTTPAETTTTTVAETTTTTAVGATTTTQPSIQCCVKSSPTGAFVDCMLLGDTQCASQNGINAGPGICSPNPCPPSTTTTTGAATTTTTTPAATTTTTTPAATTTTTAPAATTTTTAPAATTTTTAPAATTTTTAPAATTTTTTSAATTTTLAGCCGFSPKPSTLSFTTAVGSGNCGTLMTSSGVLLENLACGGLYTGGGGSGVPLPFQVPDMGTSLTGVSACSGTSLTLTNIKSTDPGASIRNCTSAGCLFGPPLPIPNAATTPISLCVINTVSADASGTADCSSGASSLSLPLNSELFLTGDLFPNAPGIQSCPVCNQTCSAGTNSGGPCNSDADCAGAGAGSCTGSVVCHGGPNNGMACTPGDSALNPSFPTTHDCPPTPALDIGGLPIAFALSSGTASATGKTLPGPVTAQARVFCGFCRDIDGAGTLCFEGAPATQAACPHNSACISAGNPFNCCTGASAGTCDQAPKACGDSAECTDGNGTWPNCQQHSPGAFGFGTANTITENGAPAGNLASMTNTTHSGSSTLVSLFCVPPTFNTSVDNTGDLPGPGAVSLPGTAQLLP